MIRVLLTDSTLAWLVPLAKKLARRCLAMGARFKIYPMQDATIQVETWPGTDLAKATIDGGIPPGYQFTGTGERLDKTWIAPDAPFGLVRRLPHFYLTFARLKQRKVNNALELEAEPKPLASTISSSEHWPLITPNEIKRAYRIAPAHQPDGIGVRDWFGQWSALSAQDPPIRQRLTHTVGQSHPLAGFGALSADRGSWAAVADQGYDYPPYVSRTARGVSYGPETPGFWRSAALHRVNHPTLGVRWFIVGVTADHRFYSHPLGVRQAPWQPDGWVGFWPNVATQEVRFADCPWPAWVTQHNVGTLAAVADPQEPPYSARLQSLWSFAPDGTKAVCIAAHRDDNFAAGGTESVAYGADNTTVWRRPQEDFPGLVEVSLEVVVTETDFEIRVSLSKNIYSPRDGIIPVAADYAMQDFSDDGVKVGDLLILEYQHYIRWGYRPSPTPPDLTTSLYPTFATVAVITAGARTLRKWLAAHWVVFDEMLTPADYQFAPRLNTLPGVPTGEVQLEHSCFTAHIVSLDLRSLSYCLASVQWVSGVVNGTNYAAEAVEVLTCAFGAEADRQTIGHPTLKATLQATRSRAAGALPDIAQFTRLHTSLKIDCTAVYPDKIRETPLDPFESTLYGKATWRLWDDGLTNAPPAQTRTDSPAYRLDYKNYNHSTQLRNGPDRYPAFPTATHIFTPLPFTYFDGGIYFRPGTAWRDESNTIHGLTAFTGYPAGAIHHARVCAATLWPLGNLHARFAVDRSTSWALCAGPFAANAQLGVGRFYAANYEQTWVDRIVFRARDKTDTVIAERTDTHIDLLSRAFGLDLTPQTYHFDLQDTATGVAVTPQSDDNTPHPAYSIYPVNALGIGFSNVGLVDYRVGVLPVLEPAFFAWRHDTYQPLMTFPTPKMEGVFYLEP